jgi:hypothetical protein
MNQLIHDQLQPQEPADASGNSLSALIGDLAAPEATLIERPLTTELKFSEAGLLHEGQTFPIDEHGMRRLCDQAHAPAWYLEKLSPALQADVLSEHARRGDFGPRAGVHTS